MLAQLVPESAGFGLPRLPRTVLASQGPCYGNRSHQVSEVESGVCLRVRAGLRPLASSVDGG